jgi:hypothetical protein
LVEIDFIPLLPEQNTAELSVLRLVDSDHFQREVDYLAELGFDGLFLQDLERHDRLFQKEIEGLVARGKQFQLIG